MDSKRLRRHRVLSLAESLETRRLLAANSSPFTANGSPWEVTPTGTSWVEAENFDYGGEGVAYHDTTTGNQGGAYRPNESVDIEGPSTSTGGTYNLGYLNPGEWTKYTLKVDTAGSYVVNLHASNANVTAAGTHISFNNSGAVVSTGNIAVPTTTGGWGTYVDHTAMVTLTAGTQVMTLADDTGGANFDYISLTPAAQAGAAEQAYNPTNPGNTAPVFRSLPTYLPAYGAAQIESEYFDTGGQAAAATGAQSGGYYWLDQSARTATYPYTATPFRPTDTIDMSDSGSGIVTSNWEGGEWAQYTVYSATNVPPLQPSLTNAAYQTANPTLTYQLLLNYSNSSATASSFSLADTSTDPATGTASLSTLTTLSLPGTGGAYQTLSTTITLPRDGQNILRLVDNDAHGANSHVNVDYIKLTNATTSGNNQVPWEVPASGTVAHIPADDVDIAPGSAIYPAGTNPVVAATGDTLGTGNDIQNLTANDAVTYTINTDVTSQYVLSLRVKNTGTTPATLQVTFDSGAAFGAAPDPVVFNLTVPVGSGYQTITTATNVSQFPQTTNNYVEIQAGTQKMQVLVLAGTINSHYSELSNITSIAPIKPDPTQSGSYATQPPDAALNSVGDLFDRVYNTKYYWINPPANAAIPTNDWWTNLLVSQFAGDMYAYPQIVNDSAAGVTIKSFNGVGTNSAGNTIINTGQQSIIVGANGTAFADDALLDYGDWTLHYRMQTTGAGYMDATTGRGLPYTWYEYNGLTPTIILHTGSDANQNAFNIYDANGTLQSGSFTADHFRIDTGAEQLAVFAPAGTTFTRAGGMFTVSFAAGVAKYLVSAVLPDSSPSTLATFYQHAYAIPRQVGATPSSKYTWTYDASAGTVTTHWNLNLVAIDPANPPASLTTIQGWLPLNYTDGATGPTMLKNTAQQPYIYPDLNGNIEISTGSTFDVVQATNGINFELALPQTIGAPLQAYDPANPAGTTVSTDYSPQQMLKYIKAYITANTNAGATASAGTTILNYGTDTYWGGKPLQEYAEFALMAKQIGDTADYNIFVSNLTTFMTDWFTYTPGEANHYFAYYPGTHSLIGFNPAYGSENFTDNMFHYGYFTAAAGVLAMLNPTWAAQYGSMAKMIAMQYANWLHPGDAPDVTDPNATSLPFLRTFEPWVGHSYAGGTSSPGGNNQESSSEAIQSWLGIVLLGQALNDPGMTAAGMMGYTMESKAVREQWFNQAPGAPNTNGLAFPSSYASANQSTGYSNVAIDFDGGKDYATYFGANPEYILGIEALPIWPSLDFLGKNAAAAAAATQSMLNQRVISNNNPAANTFASFETGGENDWLNIALGFQAQYNPQATALEYARMIAQQTPTGVTGSTGLYYFQDHSDQTYGLRNWNDHLSLPLGGVYTHGSDATAMSNTTTYMAYNPASSNTTVHVYDSNGNQIDSFTATPGYNVVTRSANGTHAPPIIVTGAAATPSTVTATTGQLSVLANDETQTESNITYAWSMASGPAGAVPLFSVNSNNAAKNTTVTFNKAGIYTFSVTATDVNGLSIATSVTVTVQSTLTSVVVSPNPVNVFLNGTQVFTASGTDQFGTVVNNPSVTWSVTGGGTITAAGSYKAPAANGSATVMATSGTSSGSATVTIVTQIAAPTNLVATMKSLTELDLSWSASSGATGYFIYRSTTPGGESAAPLNATAVTTTTYKDLAAASYTSYFYTVKAVNSNGSSAASNEASATTATDLALNKPGFSSYNENNTNETAAAAFDGDNSTRWSSYNAAAGTLNDPGWIYVNLGAVYSISEVKLNWENAAGKNYSIGVSANGTTWNPIVTVTGNTTAGWKDYTNLNTTGQYVRMYGTARTTAYGYSLFDFNVYAAPIATAVALTGSNYLELDSTVPGQLDVWPGTSNAGTPTYTYTLNQITMITDVANSNADQLTVDFSRGNPLAGLTTGGTFVGKAGGSNGIVIVGDNAGDAYQVSGGAMSFNGTPITFSNTSTITIQTGTGNDTYHQTAVPNAAVTLNTSGGIDAVTMDLNAGALTLAAPAGAGSPAAALSSLSIASGSKVVFSSAVGHSGHSVLTANSLAIAGTLDLMNNDLVLQSVGNLAAVSSEIASGNIISSAAMADPSRLTTLGVMLNDDGTGASIYVNGFTFDGFTLSAGDTLVKYTYLGDTNLDGKVDGTDYARIDSGYVTQSSTWHNGDLNGDGVINGSDYTLIDDAFNMQAAAIPAAIAANPTLAFAQTQITTESLDQWFKNRSKSMLADPGWRL